MFKIGIDVGGHVHGFRGRTCERAAALFQDPLDTSRSVRGCAQRFAGSRCGVRFTPEELLATTELLIHGTTVATNTLIERKGAGSACSPLLVFAICSKCVRA